MKKIIQLAGAVYGGMAVIIGAFGAHALKAILDDEKLLSFNTGVRYQMYHAIVLLALGFLLPIASKLEKWMGWSFIGGVFLFSFSIYLLALSTVWEVDLGFLGPITPLGGLLMITGWVLLAIFIAKRKAK